MQKMSSLVPSREFEDDRDSQLQVEQSRAELRFASLFTTIPPERIGLNGEYDHWGLAKRVEFAFRQRFLLNDVQRLTVTQRGRVVVLTGQVPNQSLLDQLINVALQVMGASDVETHGVELMVRSPQTLSKQA